MRAIATLLVAALLSGPMVTAARASTSAGWSTNEIPGLKRTNQVLSALIALLKLVDEIRALPDPGAPAEDQRIRPSAMYHADRLAIEWAGHQVGRTSMLLAGQHEAIS